MLPTRPGDGTGETTRSSLTPITHVQLLYCIVLSRLFGSFQCSKRSKTRDMHGGWQGFASTSQPTHTGCSNSEPWEQGWGSNGVHEKVGSLGHRDQRF